MNDIFPTTQWTELLALRDGAGSEGRRLALAHLYERYWTPLYTYCRRRGLDPEQAADLLQDFFAHLLEKDFVSRLELTGKLRAFLIGALKRFHASQQERARAQKRAPPKPLVSLDIDAAEKSFRELASDELSPEQAYEQQWALEMMRRTQKRLRQTEARAGRAEAFDHLTDWVYDAADRSSYAEVSAAIGLSEASARVRVHRLRKRFGRLLREDIGLTVTDPSSVDQEVRHLMSLVESSAALAEL